MLNMSVKSETYPPLPSKLGKVTCKRCGNFGHFASGCMEKWESWKPSQERQMTLRNEHENLERKREKKQDGRKEEAKYIARTGAHRNGKDNGKSDTDDEVALTVGEGIKDVASSEIALKCNGLGGSWFVDSGAASHMVRDRGSFGIH